MAESPRTCTWSTVRLQQPNSADSTPARYSSRVVRSPAELQAVQTNSSSRRSFKEFLSCRWTAAIHVRSISLKSGFMLFVVGFSRARCHVARWLPKATALSGEQLALRCSGLGGEVEAQV